MNPNELVTRKAIADVLRLSSRQISNLVEKGMPSATDNGKRWYSVPDCVAWYLEHKVSFAVATAVPADLEEARTRLTIAQARKAELELAHLEGRMVTIEESLSVLTPLLDELRSGLLAFPLKAAHLLVGCRTIGEVQARLEPAIHDLMRVLSGPQPESEEER